MKLLKNHPQFKNCKNKLWTTKEIVLFAYSHAYIPTVIINHNNKKQIESSKSLLNCDSNLKDLLKNEVKKEKFECHSITSSNMINKWIETKLQINFNLNYNKIIDIENENDHKNNAKKKLKINSTMKYYGNNLIKINDNKYGNELNFINIICNEIGIKLKPEEIVPSKYLYFILFLLKILFHILIYLLKVVKYNFIYFVYFYF